MENELLVRFTRMNPPYLANETALFKSTYAVKLAIEGAAVLLDPPAGFDIHGNRKEVKGLEGFDLADFDLAADRGPKHIGGSVYEVAGVRVKGKAKAKAVAEALADLPAPAPDSGGN